MSKKKITHAMRQKVESRAKYKCEYCQTIMEVSTQRFEIEHIYPLSLGGKSTFENMALACRGCNAHKHNKIQGFDAITEEYVELFNPRKDNWQENFSWDSNPLYLIGLIKRGRATIATLKLNRLQLISVRKLLQQLQLHPPIL